MFREKKILLKLRKMRVKLEKSMLEMSTMRRRQHKIFKGVRSSCLCVQKCEARVAWWDQIKTSPLVVLHSTSYTTYIYLIARHSRLRESKKCNLRNPFLFPSKSEINVILKGPLGKDLMVNLKWRKTISNNICGIC